MAGLRLKLFSPFDWRRSFHSR